MGFKATEAVEELSYDFNPHVKVEGIIPEPSSKAIEDYRNAIVTAMKDAGLDEDREYKMSDMDEILEVSDKLEAAIVSATADLTGIAHDTFEKLPYRIKAAFLGWIMGQFFNPEAQTPATK